MDMDINPKDDDRDHMVTFEEKVYIIADEVLSVIKELHQEHKQRINSKLIAERISRKESVKKVLFNRGTEGLDRDKKGDPLRETVDKILNSLSELIPSAMGEGISCLRDRHPRDAAPECPSELLDSAVKILKKYLDFISSRVKELEDILWKTTDYLTETEEYAASELSSLRGKFQDDRDFEKKISSHMSEMKESFNTSSDINTIKRLVFSRIENINKNIEKKKEEDMLKLQETEKILEEMSKKMSDIKNEAEAMRERSQAAELESLCDNLTGCYNRKAYDQKVEETLANLNRHNFPSSLLICDIDHFKKINDNFGHLIGDLTLKKIAKLFKEQLRRNDFIARYGGEEFAVILPYTQLEEAKTTAEKVRSFIDRSNFTFKGKEVPVTISIGISAFTKGDDASTVFERADVALYLAKNSGRNLVKTEVDVENAGKTFSDSLIDMNFDNES